MNKNQVNGAVNTLIGEAQAAAGQALGSKEQQTKRLQNTVSGDAEIVIGEAKKGVAPPTELTKRATRRH